MILKRGESPPRRLSDLAEDQDHTLPSASSTRSGVIGIAVIG